MSWQFRGLRNLTSAPVSLIVLRQTLVRACFSDKGVYEAEIEIKRFTVTQRRRSRMIQGIKIKHEAKNAPKARARRSGPDSKIATDRVLDSWHGRLAGNEV